MDRVPTPALGVQLLAASRDTGNAEQSNSQATSDLLNEVALRAALHAIKMNGNGKKPDLGQWIRWGIGLFVILVGLLWSVSILFAERPTEARVEKLIDYGWEHHAQHPESKAELSKQAAEIQVMKLQLSSINSGIDMIQKTITEIRSDLKKN